MGKRLGIIVLLLVLAACSSSTKTNAPSLRNTVEKYAEAFGDGDGRAAWVIVSARCKDFFDETDYRATVAAAGVKYKGLRVVTYRDKIDGSAATVTYDTSSSDLTYDDQRWVLERNAWRYDGC